MRIYLENEGDLELDLNYQEVAQRVGDAVLDMNSVRMNPKWSSF